MGGRVDEGVNDYEVGGQPVDRDMPGQNKCKAGDAGLALLVQRQQIVESSLPQFGDAESEHGQQHKHAGEVEALAAGPGDHDPPVASPEQR